MKAKIVEHQRGNHSYRQVLECGRTIFEGNVRDVVKKLTEMRKMCRQIWRERSTDQYMNDFVAYEMSDIFAFKFKDGRWVRF